MSSFAATPAEPPKTPADLFHIESTDCKPIVADIAKRLFEYCRARNWAGYDPYDALNSRIFEALPFLHFRWPRLVFIQGLKRCPINLRPLLLVGPSQNAKALALFLSATLKLARLGLVESPGLARALVDRLVQLRSPNTASWSWGYNFPWQTRTIIVPRGHSNLVCTTFVGGALLDAFECTGESRCLEMASSAARHILDELYWVDGAVASFSYPLPTVRVPVHNANFLAASLLCRVARLTGDRRFLEPALRVTRYSVGRQRQDGSWAYGEGDTQQWLDNFHTGYNLCALRAIGRDASTTEFEFSLRQGFDFYRQHFFTSDGVARYFHNQTFPVDSHAVAQSIITLLTLRDLHKDNLQLAKSVLNWAMKNLWDQLGFFYYQKRRVLTVRIPYMRWTQAWMLLALTTLSEELCEAGLGSALDPNGPT